MKSKKQDTDMADAEVVTLKPFSEEQKNAHS